MTQPSTLGKASAYMVISSVPFVAQLCRHAGLSSLRRGHLGLGLEGCIGVRFGKWANKPETLRGVVAAAEVTW